MLWGALRVYGTDALEQVPRQPAGLPLLRWLERPNPVRRWLADASYWLYLVHLSLVFWIQAALAPLPWHWAFKFPLVLAGTLPLGLLSYRFRVRYTWPGALLNGRRAPKPGAR